MRLTLFDLRTVSFTILAGRLFFMPHLLFTIDCWPALAVQAGQAEQDLH